MGNGSIIGGGGGEVGVIVNSTVFKCSIWSTEGYFGNEIDLYHILQHMRILHCNGHCVSYIYK
jgi:hypothetical protein